jgi:hypothetical protein
MTRPAVRALLCLAGTWIGALPALADAPVITIVNDTTEQVRIDRPAVTAATTELPSVRFQPGDLVTVSAGGCVQTGGSGKTWKRYVDPSGDNSDRLYHGRIRIPLATDDLETLASVMRRENTLDRTAASPPVAPLRVQALPEGADTSRLFLTIGYDDDSYDDNGYWGHDDGTGDQCKNVGDAFIELLIVHQPGAPIPQPQLPQAPMDLWWQEMDDNLLPLNPLWGAQVNAQGQANGTVPDAGRLCNNFHDEDDLLKLGSPPCTTWTPTVDEPSLWSDPAFYSVCQLSGGTSGAVHGHVNWGLATFTGQLVFTDHSLPVPQGTGDDDYDMTLERPDQASATTNGSLFQIPPSTVNLTSLDLEFDSDETIDFFDTPFWQELHAAVDADSSFAKARGLLGGDRGATAIVTGLVGIDNKHGAHAELHPVLGLMMRVPDRSTATSDLWVFFARTRGDEGGCSQDLHAFASTTNMRFLLPLPAGQHAKLTTANVRGNGTGGAFSLTQLPDGLLVSIDFPTAGSSGQQISSAMAWGELTIEHDDPEAGSRSRASLTERSLVTAHGAAVKPAHEAATPAAPGAKTAVPLEVTAARRQAVILLASDYLGPVRKQLSAAEWQAFLAAFQHPAQPLRTLAQPIYVTRLSVQQHISLFAASRAGAGEAAPGTTSPPLRQSLEKVAPRHRTLKITEPRRMVPSERLTNRAQLLLHQRVAAALVEAVGSARAHAMLRPPPGVTSAKPPANDPWTMPGWLQ